jgi:hypothetical protein
MARQLRSHMDTRTGASSSAGRSGADALFALVVLALAVAGCNPGASPSPLPTATPTVVTGVRGVVLAGPTCPVEQAGQSPCVRALSGATILALDSAGDEMGRTVSDTSGGYFLRLPPGTYKIAPQAVEGLMGVAAETTVTVPDGALVQLDLQYDTGIR